MALEVAIYSPHGIKTSIEYIAALDTKHYLYTLSKKRAAAKRKLRYEQKAKINIETKIAKKAKREADKAAIKQLKS